MRSAGVIRAEYTDEGLADCQAQYDALRADGFAVEHYDGDQGRGIVMPSDGSFDPVARAITFANEAVAQGCRFFEHSPALSIRSGEVVTPRGTIKATHIVVATDGSVMRLLPEAALEVRPVRLQMVATAPSVAHIERPVYARWGYDYWQQRPDGSVLIGGGRDVLRDDEETDQQVSTAQARNYLISLLNDLAVYEPITHAWAGIVGYSASGQPWVSQPREGVYGIGGYCGTGNVVGTLLGRSLIELFVEGDSQTLQDFGYLD